MKILVIEDAAPAEASSTARFISVSRPQYGVQCVTDVAEALSRLEQSCFDLVLADRRLAERDKALLGGTAGHGRPASEATPLLLLDDTVTPEAREEARRGGALDLLARSAEGMEELFRTTDRLWEARRVRERQHLLLKQRYGEETIGPCMTGGTRPR
jgi:DNA-binding NtrC family response regulator